MSWMFLAVILGACEDTTSEKDIAEVNEDRDGDGFVEDEDCNDNDASIFPGSAEICDGIDNNCDDNIDEDVTAEFYADSDGDGFGNPNISIEACSEPSGFVNNGSDCDDTENNSFPGGTEICDGKDNNCNGVVDTDAAGEVLVYRDLDNDGFGDSSFSCPIVRTKAAGLRLAVLRHLFSFPDFFLRFCLLADGGLQFKF